MKVRQIDGGSPDKDGAETESVVAGLPARDSATACLRIRVSFDLAVMSAHMRSDRRDVSTWCHGVSGGETGIRSFYSCLSPLRYCAGVGNMRSSICFGN